MVQHALWLCWIKSQLASAWLRAARFPKRKSAGLLHPVDVLMSAGRQAEDQPERRAPDHRAANSPHPPALVQRLAGLLVGRRVFLDDPVAQLDL